MPKFRKKPVAIEAVKWNGATVGLTNGGEPFNDERLELPNWMPQARVQSEVDQGSQTTCLSVGPAEVVRIGDYLFIGTLEGTHRADPGDWIIHGIKGEIYPCKPDIFADSYVYETAD